MFIATDCLPFSLCDHTCKRLAKRKTQLRMAHGCCFWIVWHVMSLNLNMGSNVKQATLNTALTIESMTKRQAQLKKLLPN